MISKARSNFSFESASTSFAVSTNRAACSALSGGGLGFLGIFPPVTVGLFVKQLFDKLTACQPHLSGCVRRALHRQSSMLTVGVAEIKFVQVTIEMMMGAMLINPLHATLKHAEEPFNDVGVDSPVIQLYIFIRAMLYGVVRTEMFAHLEMVTSFVSQYAGIRRNVRFQNRQQGCDFQVINHDRAGFASVALNQRKNFVLVCIATVENCAA